MSNYSGYKVVCGDQFPIYCPTFNQVWACANQYTHNSKIDSVIYGIDEKDAHYIMTIRAYRPRT